MKWQCINAMIVLIVVMTVMILISNGKYWNDGKSNWGRRRGIIIEGKGQ